MSKRTFDAYSIADLQGHARRLLPRGLYEFLERGSEDEVSMTGNRAAFEALRLLPRVAQDVSGTTTATTLFGRPMSMPLGIAPTGGSGLLWYRGDVALARAAAAAGVPFTVASPSTIDIEDIAACGGRLWFQLYMWESRELSFQVVRRAQAAGCEALILTLDIAVPPNREHSLRRGFAMPFRPGFRNVTDLLAHPRWLLRTLMRYQLNGGLPQQANLPSHLKSRVSAAAPREARFKQDNVVWDDIARLRDFWPGTFMVKGLLRPDDAARAAKLGVDGIIVSNHGGRATDGALPPIVALPEVVRAVGGGVTVLLDSGVRRGSDVLKALALGAKAVLVGRATLYGLAVGGEAGVGRALDLLQEEFARTMALCGTDSPGRIDRSLISDL